MPELAIYDSQGNPLDETSHQVNERVQGFFFDGVRVAVDAAGDGVEIICFFRARSSQTSRSEQYYAIFESQRGQDAREFETLIERRVEDEFGLILDTSTDDTTIFRLLMNSETPSSPLPRSRIDDLVDLIESNTQATVGTDSYRDAWGLLSEFLTERSRGRFAIAENANSSNLSHYDLIIEKGSYLGTTILQETEEEIEAMKDRRRQSVENRYGDDSSSSGLKVVLTLSVVAVVAGLGILVPFALCTVTGTPVPVISDVTGCDGSAAPTIENATWDGERLSVAGSYEAGSGNSNPTIVNLNVYVHNGSNGTEGEFIGTPSEIEVDSEGEFDFNITRSDLEDADTVQVDQLGADNYTVTIEFVLFDQDGENPEINESIRSVETSGPPAETPTSTPTAQSSTPTPTAKDSNLTSNTTDANTTSNTTDANTTSNTTDANTTSNTTDANTTSNTTDANTTSNTTDANTTSNTTDATNRDVTERHPQQVESNHKTAYGCRRTPSVSTRSVDQFSDAVGYSHVKMISLLWD